MINWTSFFPSRKNHFYKCPITSRVQWRRQCHYCVWCHKLTPTHCPLEIQRCKDPVWKRWLVKVIIFHF